MTVKVKGEPLQVFFNYTYETVTIETKDPENPTREVRVPVAIQCRIRRVIEGQTDGPVIAEGTAKCHSTDNFCRLTGRKIALARALRGTGKKSPFTKLQRERIWLSYLGSHRFTQGRGPLSGRELRSLSGSLKRQRRERIARKNGHSASALVDNTLAQAGLVGAAS